MQYSRIVDLTLTIVPGQGSRPFQIERGRTEEITDHPPVDHPWYIMHRIQTISHIGTHIEVPYHCIEHGRDLASYSAEELVGPGILLDLTQEPRDRLVQAEDMQRLAEPAGGIQKGDIVILRTDDIRLRGAPGFSKAVPSGEAMTYLVDQGAKLIGIDSSGLEGPLSRHHLECHLALLGRGVPFIENLTNLDQLSRQRFFVCALPVPVKGLESFPLRVIAFEE